ncbi:hypothetical protein N7522_007501 [Penicillium canescens]|uniref:uncharacterized protein n=1 Tax=Penicillium canescens TaxID=5083 RepID=UPI0026E08EB8|nr:uncharacterized protein N7446_009396 [Penicillium canescens]KAJ6002274.1 hypothetical protein N7522_007501 [Penicillium canescens]KAJ6046304.1 hypothetical protein N7444_007558 [Penicillium canescens]KAJ6053384.1 hypothetical protein N7446_009396 [Penicillium canescens]KAJ6165476.1 hypothetical protein N7485_008720 [Penicillium canescens]
MNHNHNHTQPRTAPTTPQRQKQSFADYIKALNKEFALEIPVPGIESPSAREGNTTPPWQIYKRLRPLFYKGCANGLLVDLREWVAGQASPAPASAGEGLDMDMCNGEARIIQAQETTHG